MGMCRSSVHSTNKVASVATRRYFRLRFLLWTVFILYSAGNSLQTVLKPLNIAAVKGTKVQLECSRNGTYPPIWTFVEYGDKMGRPVTDDHRGYSVVLSEDGISSVTFNSSEEHGGMYICQLSVDNLKVSEVIMLDGKLSCSQATASGKANASCSVDFRGNWPPEIQWHVNGKLDTRANSTTIPNRRVTSSLILSSDEAKAGPLTCSVMFTKQQMPVLLTETNIPEYSDTCVVPQPPEVPQPTRPPQPTGPPQQGPTHTPKPLGAVDGTSTTTNSTGANNAAQSNFPNLCVCLATLVVVGMSYQRLTV